MPAVSVEHSTATRVSPRTATVSSRVWLQLVEAAVARTPCSTRVCHLAVWLRADYVEVQHVFPTPHVCLAGCDEFMPSHIISGDYLRLFGLDKITDQLVCWLDHLHAS